MCGLKIFQNIFWKSSIKIHSKSINTSKRTSVMSVFVVIRMLAHSFISSAAVASIRIWMKKTLPKEFD